ncbi:MAG: hypothetical protein LC745_05715, partial [Planctomycetia bacterium]|nr:hypothetical protein [Planctomycetia bacterium]
MRRGLFVLLLLAPIAGESSVTRADGGPGQPEIDAAIARGVAFLKKEQGTRGGWDYTFNHDHELGITALAALALLENGVEPTDPAVIKAAEVVGSLASRSDQTYDLSLAILLLARVQKGHSGPNDALIRGLAGRLAGGSDEGLWSYKVPLKGAGAEGTG